MNDLDADKFGLKYDIPLMDEGIIAFGENKI